MVPARFYFVSVFSRRLLLFLVATLSLAATRLVGADWQKIAAPEFTLYSRAKQDDARRAAEEHRQFIAALSAIVKIDKENLPPLTIVMLGSAREFRDYRPARPDGKPMDVAGFFARRDGWSVFGLAGRADDDEVRRTVFHEGVHWFMSAFDESNPAWLEEGLAEVFSTFEVKKGKARWGQAIESHVALLRTTQLLPLPRLLMLSRSDPLFNEDQRTGVFYAQSWLLVHYLLFGQHGLSRSTLTDYLTAFRSGIHPDEAFRQTFKADYETIERQLEGYLRSGRYYTGGRDLVETGDSASVERAADVEVSLALARLALGASRHELAGKHVEAAMRVGGDLAAVHEVRGALAAARGDSDGVIAAYTEAVRLGSNNHLVHYELGHRRHSSAVESPGGALNGIDPVTARKIANHYERTINLRPRFLPAYQGLAGIIELADRTGASDRDFLLLGEKLFPQDGMIQLGLAVLERKDGDTADACRRVEAVLEHREGKPFHVIAYARRLEGAWQQNDFYQELHDLTEKRRYREAIERLDAFVAKGVQAHQLAGLHVTRRNLVGNALMQDAQKAWEARDWKEARRLLEEVVASNASGPIKLHAQRQLAELDKRNRPRD